jgi:gliding motility-associated-like protein
MKKLYLIGVYLYFFSFTIYAGDWSNKNKHSFDGFFIKNTELLPNNNVTFFSKNKFGNILIEQNSINFQFIKFTKNLDIQKISEGEGENLNYDILTLKQTFIEGQFGTPNSIIESHSTSNFFYGSDKNKWRTNLENYNGLRYNNIYKNIDLKIYSSDVQIKYDIILRPGFDISDLKTAYEGAEKISIESSKKSIVIDTKFGKFHEKMPEVYQIINGQKVIIDCSYLLNDKQIGYKLEKYNPNYEVVIDPTLIYATYFGSTGDDYFLIGDLAKDNLGNIYTTGCTNNLNFPTTPGAYSAIYAGGLTDIFVFKYAPNGLLLASTFIGGNDYDFGFGIDIDSNGNPVIGGVSWSGNFPTTLGTYQPIHSPVVATNGDITVTRFTANLDAVINSTFIGGNADEQAHEIVIGSNGSIYIGGQARAGMPTTIGSYQPNCNGDYDYFASILSSNFSNLIASTYIGGASRDRGNGIAIDGNFNVYLTGYVEGVFPTTSGAYDVTFGGSSDVTVVKFNPTLSSLIYSTYLGGSGADLAQSSIEVINEKAIVVGTAGSSNFPTTPGSYSTIFGGISDVFVTKLNVSGSQLIFSTFLGSNGTDQGWNVCIADSGKIVVTGNCSNNFPTTNCVYDNTFNGGLNDAFISIFDSTCTTLLYSSYYGGSGDESGRACVTNSNNQFIIGHSTSANLDFSSNALDSSYNGNRDIFLAIFDQSSSSHSFTTNITCSNTPVSFNTSPGLISANWNFGDPVSGINNISNLLNPNHQFSSAGNYTITLIASNGCNTDTIVQTITLSPPIITTSIPDTSLCENSSLLLTASGGNNYTWNNGITSTNDSVLVTISTNTQYIVFSQNAGCPTTADTINVTVIPNFTVQIIGDSATCAGNTLTLIAGGTSAAFQWAGIITSVSDTITVTPIANSTIYLQGTGGQCNNMMDSINIIVSNPLITTSIPDTLVCENSSLLLTASGGTNYTWNNGITSSNDSVLVTISSNMQYIVFAQSPGCPNYPDTINVTALPNPTAFIIGDSVICIGSSLNLVANGNANSFQWTGGLTSTNDSITITPVANTVIYLQGIGNNCNSPLDTINITVSNPPIAQFSNSNTLCANSNVTFNATSINATSYYWNFGDSLTNPLYFSFQQNPIHSFDSAGVYLVSLIVYNSCSSDTLIQPITIGTGPNANLPSDTVLCVGQNLTLGSSGGMIYNWSGDASSTNDSITVAPNANSVYTLTISNGICFGLTDTIFVGVEFPSTIKIVGDNNLYCPGDSVRLYGTGGTNLLWNVFGTIQNENPITLSANTGGMIYAYNNATICPASLDSFYLNVANKSEAIFSLSVDSCLNIATLQNNSIGASSYKWQILDILESDLPSPQFNISTSMEYEIMLITNPNSNCADSLTQKIFLNDNYGNNFFIPNTFTPNKDQLNDEFRIGTWNNCKYFKLYIYNRWGNLIHFNEGTEVKWNGVYKGNEAPTGVYVYILQFDDIEKTGTVTLFR